MIPPSWNVYLDESTPFNDLDESTPFNDLDESTPLYIDESTSFDSTPLNHTPLNHLDESTPEEIPNQAMPTSLTLQTAVMVDQPCSPLNLDELIRNHENFIPMLRQISLEALLDEFNKASSQTMPTSPVPQARPGSSATDTTTSSVDECIVAADSKTNEMTTTSSVDECIVAADSKTNEMTVPREVLKRPSSTQSNPPPYKKEKKKPAEDKNWAASVDTECIVAADSNTNEMTEFVPKRTFRHQPSTLPPPKKKDKNWPAIFDLERHKILLEHLNTRDKVKIIKEGNYGISGQLSVTVTKPDASTRGQLVTVLNLDGNDEVSFIAYRDRIQSDGNSNFNLSIILIPLFFPSNTRISEVLFNPQSFRSKSGGIAKEGQTFTYLFGAPTREPCTTKAVSFADLLRFGSWLVICNRCCRVSSSGDVFPHTCQTRNLKHTLDVRGAVDVKMCDKDEFIARNRPRFLKFDMTGPKNENAAIENRLKISNNYEFTNTNIEVGVSDYDRNDDLGLLNQLNPSKIVTVKKSGDTWVQFCVFQYKEPEEPATFEEPATLEEPATFEEPATLEEPATFEEETKLLNSVLKSMFHYNERKRILMSKPGQIVTSLHYFPRDVASKSLILLVGKKIKEPTNDILKEAMISSGIVGTWPKEPVNVLGEGGCLAVCCICYHVSTGGPFVHPCSIHPRKKWPKLKKLV